MDLKQLFSRVEWCRKNECLPYVMRDIACWDCKDKEFLIDYAAYCNQPAFFKKMCFEDFLLKRHKNKERIKSSLEIYKTNRKGMCI
jgi:hypothetical protein